MQGPFFSAPGFLIVPNLLKAFLFEMAQSDRRSKLDAQIAAQEREHKLKRAVDLFKKYDNVARSAREAGVSRDLLRG
jgi:hypothetical protein